MAGPKERGDMTVAPVSWNNPPDSPPPAKNQVHLWRFRLDRPAAEIEALEKLLSSDERERAARLRDPRKSLDFIAARGQLRQLLSRYLDSPPPALRFGYRPGGKPFVIGAESLFFNLAHSGTWGLLGISGRGELGVDLEFLNAEMDFQAIARQFFTASEQARLAGLPPGQRRQAFFILWTAREARLKALGDGFSKPRGNRTGTLSQVRHFPVAPAYLGALAMEAEGWEMVCWNFVAGDSECESSPDP